MGSHIANGEVPTPHQVKNKSHILKVMFLAATARLCFDAQGNCNFDGKIGIWPFVEQVQAQQSSNCHAAGTWETKPINVDKDTNKQFVLEKVIPAIKEKWPRSNGFHRETIRLQYNNATSHFDEADEDWVDCCFQNQHMWCFELKEQPANSPETNILDLGFFRVLQSLQFERGDANIIGELIANVHQAWAEYKAHKINHVFLTHQTCIMATTTTVFHTWVRIDWSTMANFLTVLLLMLL